MALSAVRSRVRIPHSPNLTRLADAQSADGPLGDTAKQVGGPFDEKGVIGGTVQNAAETAQGDKPSAFDAQGMIGEKFTSQYCFIPPLTPILIRLFQQRVR